MNGRHRLQVWRSDKDKTQHQIARLAGMSQTRYWQIENGEGAAAPSFGEKRAIASALGVAVSAIAWPERDQQAAS